MSNELSEAAADCFTAQASHPLESADPSGSVVNVDAAFRAHALEYIAAQLGQINAKLDKIVKTFPQSGQKE